MQRCQALGLRELDLKGSMLPSVAHFLWGFNPRQEVYHNFTLNRMSLLQQVGYRVFASKPLPSFHTSTNAAGGFFEETFPKRPRCVMTK
jgi:hypothetical protein